MCVVCVTCGMLEYMLNVICMHVQCVCVCVCAVCVRAWPASTCADRLGLTSLILMQLAVSPPPTPFSES